MPVQNIVGKVAQSKQTLVGSVHSLQAVIETDAGQRVVCLWRGSSSIKLITDKRYRFTGSVRLVKGRQVMLNPQHKVLPAVAVAAPLAASVITPHIATQSAAEPQLKPIRRVGKVVKRTATAVALGFVGLLVLGGIVGPSSDASLKSKDTTANASSLVQPADNTDTDSAKTTSPVAPPETPDDCDVKTIPFATTTKNDASLPLGQTKLSPAGSNGQDKVCYVHGRNQSPTTTHVTMAIDQVKLVGTYVAPKPAPAPSYQPCNGYINVDGNCIPSPSTTGGTVGGYSPSYTCVDGTYSYAQHAQGACSHHGGILR